jgi:uncharacterized protein (DUF4415 family)
MPEKRTEKQRPGSSPDSPTDRTTEESEPDIPEPTPEQIARAVARRGLKPAPGKEQITLRVDADVLAWFREQGQGYQSRINALLREYMNAHVSGTE